MKTRHVFSTPDIASAQAAMDAARDGGVEDHNLLLVARSDIELSTIPNDRKEADTDMMPAAVRGAGYGGATGLLVGLVAFAIPPLGVTLAGAAAAGLAGAMVGCWASALAGASLPDPIRRRFEGEIEAGRILVVVDGSQELLAKVEPAITSTGATLLPFEAPSLMA
ncbi:hypothetical protein N800_07065 [Lysobacter daejeonensis GH1-9]|uniref:DUF1269 domain-containing protein n=1 Tax=Lysobacter daejeonensis GH1-9 TaxID=1385517 RepID=A0A0A0ET00_9GAMM|nr:hypothetical protein [Lysobacter daejeonensis]KGM53659.1 hypothetical protein N800_07065 [Lysobacter daejeonensis GH1-9]